MVSEITYREIVDLERIQEAVDLQNLVWGKNNSVPLTHFVAAVHNGGIMVGAYDKEKLVGFCYGFPSFKNGEAYLCSHLLAIDPDYRNRSIGQKIKLFQRDWCLQYGYKRMIWTFDPLETRNAYLNLCKLGGVVRRYIQSYYGELDDEINRGMPTDRLLLEWYLDSERVQKVADEGPLYDDEWQQYPCIVEYEEEGDFVKPLKLSPLTGKDGYRISVPSNLADMKIKRRDLVLEWRFALREAFTEAFSQGYEVVGLLKTDCLAHNYILKKRSE